MKLFMKNITNLTFFSFDPDPSKRHTVWSLVLGGTVVWLVVYGVNQSQVQRYMSTKTLAKAKKLNWLHLKLNFTIKTVFREK